MPEKRPTGVRDVFSTPGRADAGRTPDLGEQQNAVVVVRAPLEKTAAFRDRNDLVLLPEGEPPVRLVDFFLRGSDLPDFTFNDAPYLSGLELLDLLGFDASLRECPADDGRAAERSLPESGLEAYRDDPGALIRGVDRSREPNDQDAKAEWESSVRFPVAETISLDALPQRREASPAPQPPTPPVPEPENPVPQPPTPEQPEHDGVSSIHDGNGSA